MDKNLEQTFLKIMRQIASMNRRHIHRSERITHEVHWEREYFYLDTVVFNDRNEETIRRHVWTFVELQSLKDLEGVIMYRITDNIVQLGKAA